MFDDSSTKSKDGPSVKKMMMSAKHRFLRWLDPESIRVFLRKCNGYCRELNAHASKLSVESLVSLEPARPVGLIYCIDAEQLESALECRVVDGCDDVQSLMDDVLRSFLDKEALESATVVTQDELSKMVESLHKIDMTVKSAKMSRKTFRERLHFGSNFSSRVVA